MDFIIKRVKEHYEVYDKEGRFLFSADSYAEAYDETQKLIAA
jgi:hypothetical protein